MSQSSIFEAESKGIVNGARDALTGLMDILFRGHYDVQRELYALAQDRDIAGIARVASDHINKLIEEAERSAEEKYKEILWRSAVNGAQCEDRGPEPKTLAEIAQLHLGQGLTLSQALTRAWCLGLNSKGDAK